MSYILGSQEIVIEGLVRHWDVKKVIDDLNQVLLSRNYSPIYYFEGTPVSGEGGMIVRIVLAKPITSDDRAVVKKLLEINGLVEKKSR